MTSPKSINVNDPIIVLSGHLKSKDADFFNKLNARARLTCERIADGVQLNWLDKLGTKVLQNQFEKLSLAGKVWSSLTTALYKVTILFQTIIYWNWKAPTGEAITAKFQPKQPNIPQPNPSPNKPLEPKPNPTPLSNRPISGPSIEEVSSSDDEEPSSSEINQAPKKFREVAQAIQDETNDAPPSMIAQLRSSIPGSTVDSPAFLDVEAEIPKVDINLVKSIASEITQEKNEEEAAEIAPAKNEEEAAEIEARMKAEQERIDNFMRKGIERQEQAKPQESLSGKASDEDQNPITDEDVAAL